MRRSTNLWVASTFFFLGTGALAQAPNPGLTTLDGAVRRALAQHPDILAAQQRIRQAEFKLTGTRALPNPELDLGHGQSFTSPGAGNTDSDIQITQRLNVFGQRKTLTTQASFEVETSRIELRQTEQEIAFRVRSAWFGAQSAQATVAFAKQTLGVAETFARLAEAQYKAGEVPIANVLRSEFEAENTRQALLIAETDVKVQSAALNTLLQQPLGTPLALPSLTEVTLRVYEDEKLLLQSLLSQPKLLAAQAIVRAQEAGIDVAKSAARPELAIVYTHNQIQNWLGGNSYRVGVTLPLLDRGQIRAGVNTAKAATQEKEAELASVRQQVELDLNTALFFHEQAHELAQRTGGEQLQRAVRLYQLAEIGYREGAASYLNVLDALGVLRTAYQSYLKALTDYNIAEAGLERALGASLPLPLRSQSLRYEPPTLTAPGGNGKKQ